MYDSHSTNNAVKKSVVLIEKWIASNEDPKDDNDNVPIDIEAISETNQESMSNNGERTVNSEKLLLETFEINEDNRMVPGVQQLTNDSVSSVPTGIDKNPEPSKSKRKWNIEGRHSCRSKTDLQSRTSNYLNDNLFSYQFDSAVAVHGDDEREHGSNENLSEDILTSDKVNEHRHKKVMPTATVTSSHLFKLDHDFYEDIEVTEAEPHNLPTHIHMEEQERPISIITSNGGNEDFNGRFPDKQVNELRNYPDENYAQQNVIIHPLKSELAELYSYEHPSQNPQIQDPQIQLVDDDANDQSIDYSMSNRHHVLRVGNFAYNNSTVSHSESRSLISPAATLRTGFGRTGFLPYPARSFINGQHRATRNDLYYPVAQQAFERSSISQYMHSSVSGLHTATNGGAEHSSGTITETLNASTQTELEQNGDHSWGENWGRVFLENQNNFILNLCATMVVIANCKMSPSFVDGSSEMQSENATSYSKNSANLPLENLNGCKPHDEETQTANIPKGRRKKNARKKGRSPQRRSQRLLDLDGMKEKVSQNTDEAVVVTSKKAKRDVDHECKVDNTFAISAPDGNWMDTDTAPHKITFSAKIISLSMETPRRPSKYISKKRI